MLTAPAVIEMLVLEKLEGHVSGLFGFVVQNLIRFIFGNYVSKIIGSRGLANRPVKKRTACS